MSRTYFGTDGIRGTVNIVPMTADIAMRVGIAAGRIFRRGDHRHRVVIGKDTRLSGYMFEPALTAGFVATGMDVILVGPMPTPAVAMLTRSLRADLGVMISASHNPHQDNGIKLFGPDGFKLSDRMEQDIERLMANGLDEGLVAPEKLGRASRLADAEGRYIEFAKATLPAGLTLDGMKVVIDCAHGAAYKVAPTVLWELGAEVIPIGVKPNGFNINDACGSTAPERMAKAVIEEGADLGIALDGDADRLILADETGRIVDGDQLMALIATSWQERNLLKGGGLVATSMSNLGLERYLAEKGLSLARTDVGDRYVVAHMRRHGFNLGGEQSGHIVMSDYTTTGDGLIAGLQILSNLVSTGRKASEATTCFETVPQCLKSVRFQVPHPLDHEDIRAAIDQGRLRLGNAGRLVIRKSGTEPLVRVMAEGDDPALVHRVVDDICQSVESAV
ncbi:MULTISPECIES: phosphoglucosamine mutase [unclassified Iodidimonas]|jgi:phosphoglucosamine mutase|uniref:phosphoglucosamine mutase n=1 Tax=unclassified Iodidimonas TaxID=2626145 RepID=UPI0024821187|nr:MULTISPECIES: phosphoglucosamine mutase [unclassified Iodidimonas]